MLNFLIKLMRNKTTSPKGGKRGCLCKDNTYSKECCQGELIEQGVGSTLGQQSATITNTNAPRTIVTNNG
jgi:hypothetical protein